MKRAPLRNHIESISQTCWAGCDTRPTFVPLREPTPPSDLPPHPRPRFVTRIAEGERGLLFRGGRFVRILGPGSYRIWDALLGSQTRVEIVSAATGRFDHVFVEAILQDPKASEHFAVLELGAGEGAMVWIGDQLAALHGPGRYIYWNVAGDLTVERFNVPTEARSTKGTRSAPSRALRV